MLASVVAEAEAEAEPEAPFHLQWQILTTSSFSFPSSHFPSSPFPPQVIKKHYLVSTHSAFSTIH